MASCPKCSTKIPLHALLFSIVPIWITCRHCQTPLQGNLFIRFQTIVVLVLSFIAGGAVVSAANTYDLNLSSVTFLLICGVFGITLPNAVASLKWGQFDERD
jgi:hypothetical protein